MTRRRPAWAGLLCPEDPAHGPLIALPASGRLYCPSARHDGRLRSHPEGEAPATRPFFSLDEAEAVSA